MVRYRNRQCGNPACGLRFPVAEASPLPETCPRCAGVAPLVDAAYATHEARGCDRDPGGPALEILVDNVRSVRNLGSMFRTADACGVRRMHLCGITSTPAHSGVAKTALGAERTVAWTHAPDGLSAATELIDSGARLWALEAGPRSVSIFDLRPDDLGGGVLCLVVGHEVSGIDPRILGLCERVLRIPMLGHKGSLNVSVALGVGLYALRFGPARPGSTDPAR